MSTRTRSTRHPTVLARSANDTFKRRSSTRFRLAIGAAVLLHGLLLVYGPAWLVDEPPPPPDSPMQAITLVTEIEDPRILEPIPRPAPPAGPPIPDIAVPETIDVTTVDLLDDPIGIDPIPPPPEFVAHPLDEAFEFAEYVHVAPYMVAPELVNRREVQRSLQRNYPRALQSAGVEGTLMVWFWIDEHGTVQKYEIRETSGNRLLDEAAERVIDIMEFRPATHRGEAVPVIVALPITFEVR